MGAFFCPPQTNLELGICENSKHSGKGRTRCFNEYCCEKPEICLNCGVFSKKMPNQLLCKLCSIGEEDDDEEQEDKVRKSHAPCLKLSYSASRDPTKLECDTRQDGSFKVGTEEQEQ